MTHGNRRLASFFSPDAPVLRVAEMVTTFRSEFYDQIGLPKHKRVQIDYPACFTVLMFAYVSGIPTLTKAYAELSQKTDLWRELSTDVFPTRKHVEYFLYEVLGVSLYRELCEEIAIRFGLGTACIIDGFNMRKARRNLYRLNHDQRRFLLRSIKPLILQWAKSNDEVKNHYSDEDILNTVIYILTHNRTLNGYCEQQRYDLDVYERDEGMPLTRTPTATAHAVLNRIRKWFPTEEEFLKAQNELLARIFSFLKKRRPELFNGRSFPIAFDVTSIPVWAKAGKRNAKLGSVAIHMDAKASAKGTLFFRKYLVCSIVVRGYRFVVAFLPLYQTELSNIHHRVKLLIDSVRAVIRIGVIVADKQFETKAMMKMLSKMKLKYAIPTRRDKNVQKMIDQQCGKVGITDRVVDNEVVGRMVIFKDPLGLLECDTFAVSTNIPVTAESAHHLKALYDCRWGIETAFNQILAFGTRTTSKDNVIKTFFYGTSVIIHNLWVLTNLVALMLFFNRIPDAPPITKDHFKDLFSAPDPPSSTP